MARRCAYCNVPITGCTPFCRTHKYARRRGARRVAAENLLVDTVGGASGGWWAWTSRGDVIACGDTRDDVLIMLGLNQTIEDDDA